MGKGFWVLCVGESETGFGVEGLEEEMERLWF